MIDRLDPPISCRIAGRCDIDGIVAVFLGCWSVTYAAVLPPSLVGAMTRRQADELWTGVLDAVNPGEVIVAEPAELLTEPLTGGIAGVVRWSVEAPPQGAEDAEGTKDTGDTEGTVDSLYVSPAIQGRGVGSALLTVATERLSSAGVTTARLWVFRDNGPSIAFYRRMGWRPDGATRVEDTFGEPEIRLVKGLSR